jgi:hypothetical protein
MVCCPSAMGLLLIHSGNPYAGTSTNATIKRPAPTRQVLFYSDVNSDGTSEIWSLSVYAGAGELPRELTIFGALRAAKNL